MVLILTLLLTIRLGNTMNCEEAWAGVLDQSYEDSLLLLYYSGNDINDLGKYEECKNLDSSRYILTKIKTELIDLFLGICGPKECTPEDYSQLTHDAFIRFNITAVADRYNITSVTPDIFVYIDPSEHTPEMSGGVIFAISVWVLLLLCMISGTIFDYLKNQMPDRRFGPFSSFLMIFSITSNGKKLFSLPENTDDRLSLFNGVRVIGMIWIILGHSYVFQFQAVLTNPEEILNMLSDYAHKSVEIAFYLVDTFFWMAGFLVAFLTIPELKKRRGKLNWCIFILHRVIRIAPIYFFCFMNFLTLEQLFGNTPQWINWYYYSRTNCEKYWWTNLLFLNNFIPTDEMSCMGWSWYIANDIQLYLITPFLILAYYMNKAIGYILIFSLIVVNWVIIASLSTEYHYNPGFIYGAADQQQYIDNYIKPYTRLAPFVIGIMFGFMYRAYVDSDTPESESGHVELKSEITESFKPLAPKKMGREASILASMHKMWVRYPGYIIGTGLIIFCAFIPTPIDKHGPDEWSQPTKTTYLVFEHTLATIGISLIILPMLIGHGRILFKVLAFKYLAPIARVTFAMYCLHPMLIIYYSLSKTQAVVLSDSDVLYHFFGTVFLAIGLSLFLTLLVETPVMNLEKMMLRKGK